MGPPDMTLPGNAVQDLFVSQNNPSMTSQSLGETCGGEDLPLVRGTEGAHPSTGGSMTAKAMSIINQEGDFRWEELMEAFNGHDGSIQAKDSITQ